jgi:hypothetical protein
MEVCCTLIGLTWEVGIVLLEPLRLLAPDGIICVTFGQPLTGEQALAVLHTTQTVKTVEELEQSLRGLGSVWGVATETKIMSRKVDLPGE